MKRDRSALTYLRRKLYQLNNCILSAGKRIKNQHHPSPCPESPRVGERRVVQKPGTQISGGSFYIARVKLHKLLFRQFFLLQRAIFQHCVFFHLLSPMLQTSNKYPAFPGVTEAIFICFLIMLRRTLSSKYSSFCCQPLWFPIFYWIIFYIYIPLCIYLHKQYIFSHTHLDTSVLKHWNKKLTLKRLFAAVTKCRHLQPRFYDNVKGC